MNRIEPFALATLLAVGTTCLSSPVTAQDQKVTSAQKDTSEPVISTAALKKATRDLEDEPGLEELLRAALRLADADRHSTRNWMKSTNWSAVLPTLKLTAEHDMERDESLDRYQDEPDRWGADTDRDLGFQVSAQWHLNELIFNPDEVRVYGAIANRAARREALSTVIIGYYYERRKLQMELAISPPRDLQGLLEIRLRIQELTSLIDALTGGLLSRNLASKH